MAYTPITTMFDTPFSSTTVLSPLTPLTITPVSPLSPLSVSIRSIPTITQSVVTSTNPLTIVTPIGPVLHTRPSYLVDIDTGMDDNYYVQRDVTKYLLYKTLDKWIFNEFPSVLKYLVVDKDSIKLVKNEAEKEKNEISKNTAKENEMKSDWIEENILGETEMKDILKRIMNELGLKWYELPHRESLVRDVVEKYIKKKLRNKMEGQ
jgi:hypothetical protein